ncbi:MAG TPA: DUF4190 domain-containing protein [Anaerolineae bacterium]
MTASYAENNPMALTSIISAAVAWVVGALASCALAFVFPPFSLCTGIVFIVGSVVAVVSGHIGRRQIRQSGGLQGGDSLALTGLVLGWIGIAVNLLLFCFLVLGIFGLIALGPQIGNVFSDIVRELSTPAP